MKRKLFLIILLLLVVGCTKEEKKVKTIPEEIPVATPSILIEEYVDDNPIKIGLYQGANNVDKLVHNYSHSWVLNEDILVFCTYFVNEEEVPFGNAFDMIKYMEKYNNIDDYRIGYNLIFSLTDGTNYNVNILKPSDAEEIYDYFQVYLYDDIQHKNDSWYSHITNEEFNEKTYMTSIKLTGCTKTNDVVSPFKLSVFSYNDMNDFDDDGNYRGNSIHTVNISR